jgi:hypothetical protein
LNDSLWREKRQRRSLWCFQQGAFVTLSAGKAVMSLASLSVSGVGSLSAGGQRTEQDEKCS